MEDLHHADAVGQLWRNCR